MSACFFVRAVSDACVEAGSLNAYSVHLSSGLCPARGSQTITLKGTPCGPSNSLVQWEALSAPACGTVLSRATLDPKQQADWVGQCGVPPMQISGLPTKICGSAATMGAHARRHRVRTVAPPLKDTMSMPEDAPDASAVIARAINRANLAKGESTTNWGMARIGALSGTLTPQIAMPVVIVWGESKGGGYLGKGRVYHQLGHDPHWHSLRYAHLGWIVGWGAAHLPSAVKWQANICTTAAGGRGLQCDAPASLLYPVLPRLKKSTPQSL